MNRDELTEIIECLPEGRRPFYYFKDRYALMLIGLAFAAPATKRQVCEAGFGRLLEKQVVKSAMGACGSNIVSAAICDSYWPGEYACYVLSLGVWESRNRGWEQTSRRGFNLVLQMNFSTEHTDQYYKLVDPMKRHPFECLGHPISRGNRRTLAWARLDIDLAGDEALIEEIQNDWLRRATWIRNRAKRCGNTMRLRGNEINSSRVIKYVDEVLAPHFRIWDEAMLAATVWFLRKEIGISRIFYHTYEYGTKLKRIRWSKPPRSIYTTLPRRFCFRKTDEVPGFLVRHARGGKARRLLKEATFQSIAF